MERALMAAYLKHSKFLEVKDLDAAAKSLQLGSATSKPALKNNIVYGLAVVVVILAALLIYQMTRDKEVAAVPEPVKQQTAVSAKPEPKPEPAPAPAHDTTNETCGQKSICYRRQFKSPLSTYHAGR